MSEATFEALAEQLCAQSWALDPEAATRLAPKMRETLVAAARWAQRFEIGGGWFKTDYAALAAPDVRPPASRITQVLATCRAQGETSRYGATYINLVLRWSWAEEQIALDDLTPPYAGALEILLAGSGLHGEHGFIGPGFSALWTGPSTQHL